MFTVREVYPQPWGLLPHRFIGILGFLYSIGTLPSCIMFSPLPIALLVTAHPAKVVPDPSLPLTQEEEATFDNVIDKEEAKLTLAWSLSLSLSLYLTQMTRSALIFFLTLINNANQNQS